MNWLRKNKKTLFKVFLLFICIILISLSIFLIFYFTGIIKFDEGFSFNLDLFDEIKGHWWSYLVFLLLQVIFTTLLCFAPGGSMAFILLGVALFGATWETFLLCFSGVIISSTIMYLLGRFGGYKICAKLIGEEDLEKATKLIKDKGQVYYPVMMAIGGFPDDALVCIAGIIKMNFLYFSLSTFIGRGIGVAFTVFGISLIPFETFDSLWDWIICITVIVFWLIVLLYICNKITKYLDKKRKNEK